MNTIVYIGGFELPDKNAAAQRVIGNAKVLRELGYNVVLVDVDRECTKSIVETRSECFGFTRFSVRYTADRLTSIKDFAAVMKIYRADTVSVIAYNYPGIALWKMKNYCRKRGIRIYADCTEWYGMLGDNIVKRMIKGTDSYIRMNIVQPRLDGVIAISRYIEGFYKDKLPTICIPPLTDVSEEKWNPVPIEDHDGVRILYAGNPGKHKDKINLIIEALADIGDSDVFFDIVGISEEQFLNYYPEDVAVLAKVRKNVNFRGRLPHENVIAMLKKADFSMFYREITRVTMAGFPTKFSEAITCGTPVVTNKTSDLEEYLIDGQNGCWIDADIEYGLKKILSTDIREIHSMKKNMNQRVFHYQNYLCLFELLFENKR